MFRSVYILIVCVVFNILIVSALAASNQRRTSQRRTSQRITTAKPSNTTTESNRTSLKPSDNNTENCSVDTKLGSILGFQANTIFDEKPFCSYLGIRYGLAPTGDRRFKVNDFTIFTFVQLGFNRNF